MKRLKKIFLVLFIISVVAIIIKSQIRLVKLSDRAVSPCTVDIGDVGGFTSVKDIAEYAKRKAADDLEFSRHNDIANRKANCVGYAQYAAAICNKIFKQNNVKATAKPVVGCYYLLGVNIHEILLKMLSDQQTINFIKDHDYVEVVDASGKVVCSFDPSVYDLTLLDFSE